ncbi:MAG: L,D-transpeptidase family protein, partial [Micrococcales bacterium]|nr:L,D-transpeptidase family protein [Micrococcales bacterium]
SEPESEPEAAADAKPVPESEDESAAEGEPEPTVDAEPNGEAEAASEPEAEAKAELDAEDESEVEGESEPKAEGEPEPAVDAEPNGEAEAASEPEAEAKAELDAEDESAAEGEPEPEAAADAKPEPEAEDESAAEGELEPVAEAESEAEDESAAEGELETVAEAESEAEDELAVEGEPEPKAEGESKTEGESEPVAEGEPEPKAEGESKAEGEPEPAAEAEPEAEAEPKTEVIPAATEVIPAVTEVLPVEVEPVLPVSPPTEGLPTVEAAKPVVTPTQPRLPSAIPTWPADEVARASESAKIVKTRQQKRHRRVTVLLVLLIVLVLVAAGGVFGLNWYFQDKAKPGVELAGQSLVGKTAKQVQRKVTKMAEAFDLSLTDGKSTITATAEQLGVRIDIEQTVDQVMAAGKGQPIWRELSPWEPKSVDLIATVDQSTLQEFLNTSFVESSEKAVNASVVLNKSRSGFEVVPGRVGLQMQTSEVIQAIDQALTGEKKGSYLVTSFDQPPAITDQDAQRAVQIANQALDVGITFTCDNELAKAAKLGLDRSMRLDWISFQPYPPDHAIEVVFDQSAIRNYVTDLLSRKMAVPAQPEVWVTRPDTAEDIGVSQWGSDGVKVLNPGAISDRVINALQAGESVSIPVELANDEYTTVRQPAPSRFDVPNGDPWVDVNLSTFRATTYRGTTQIDSYIISTGRTAVGHGTPTGTFYVYMKFDFQVMRGPASDPYEAPTNWVSYFSNGIAFHSAPWNEPNNWGIEVSHGCVNMHTWDAKSIYDFAPIGTMVEVHY